MMRKPNRKPLVRDTVFMSGWLFADLLLALAVLFLAANTIGIKIPPPPPPKLMVTPTHLDPTSSNCSGGFNQPQCTVTLSETADSQGDLNWTAGSEISTGLIFTPASGHLSPGKSKNIQISHIACENDSITFAGSRGTTPVRILWQCTPPQERLDFKYQSITIPNVDYNGLLQNTPSAINYIKNFLKSQAILQHRSVGLALVSDGAPTNNEINQAFAIADKVISILVNLGKEGFAFQRASYYNHLFTSGAAPTIVKIDIYLFIQ